MSTDKFDYIFAGFGLSGMSLLYELSKNKNFKEKSVLIIDRDTKESNDRTWSFWHNGENDFTHLAKKTWKNGWFYAQDGLEIALDLENYSYSTIEGIDFYNFVNKHLKRFSNIHRVYQDLVHVSDEGKVLTNEREYIGELVFKSYFDKLDFQKRNSNYFLWQHFFGYVIKTEKPAFDANRFVLMDYRFSDEKRTNFFYILPYSETEALVEFTEFSAHKYTESNYKEMLLNYIHEHLNITNYQIEQVEFNAIPMTDFQLKTVVSKHVINIGSMAGYVKPSSGYAFTRTLERNKKLAALIDANIPVNETQLNSSKTYKAFDNAVLYLMQTEKVHGGLIFSSLFERRSADFVFKFLDENANAFELFQIMLASPKKMEFIKYFIKKRGK
jgi:lycopene beta-cyclase